VVLKRIVTAVQVMTIAIVIASLILLVVRQPPASSSGATDRTSAGAALFADRCASCHGPGGVGASAPQLVGRVVQAYPNIEDQIAVVEGGKGNGAMPAFQGTLSAADIRSIVDFTRSPAGGGGGSSVPPDGKAIYLDQCAACHGDFGEGTYGPAFKGGLAAQKYPDVADQTAVVVNGVNGTPMRPFGPKLSPAEIQAVVEYTRTL
jgi:cytochrome c oxidase cbb3-type subunit 3